MSRSSIFEWHKLFREGRELVEDDQRAGRPLTSRTDDNVLKIKQLLNSDRRLGIKLISDEMNLSYGTVQRIITEDLSMRKVCAKMVPKVLSDEQKELRVEISQEILDCLEEDEHFLDNVITGDETWVFQYDPETKRQSEEWHTAQSPRQKKARMSKSKVKSMLIAFFDRRGIVHKEFVPPGQIVNARFYVEVLTRLRNRITRVRPDLVGKWKLHHDNAPCHGAWIVRDLLAKFGVSTLSHPPYSPDVAPPDFFLFPRIKRQLKGHRFDSVEAVQAATTRALYSIPEDDFQEAFVTWKARYQKCVDAQGTYFEEY